MARTKRAPQTLKTIWEVDDTLWNDFIYPVIRRFDPPAETGRKRTDERAAFNGIIYHARTGCQWEALPECFGKKSSVHRALQRWEACGALDEIWAILIDHCDELDGVDWQWQSADGVLGKARFGGMPWAKIPRIAGKTARNAA
jgi:putative transposase